MVCGLLGHRQGLFLEATADCTCGSEQAGRYQRKRGWLRHGGRGRRVDAEGISVIAVAAVGLGVPIVVPITVVISTEEVIPPDKAHRVFAVGKFDWRFIEREFDNFIAVIVEDIQSTVAGELDRVGLAVAVIDDGDSREAEVAAEAKGRAAEAGCRGGRR